MPGGAAVCINSFPVTFPELQNQSTACHMCYCMLFHTMVWKSNRIQSFSLNMRLFLSIRAPRMSLTHQTSDFAVSRDEEGKVIRWFRSSTITDPQWPVGLTFLTEVFFNILQTWNGSGGGRAIRYLEHWGPMGNRHGPYNMTQITGQQQ